MNFMKKLFGAPNSSNVSSSNAERSDTDTIRKIVATLEAMDEAQAKYIAAFSYLLGRVAHADLDISDEETAEMEKIVSNFSEIGPEQAILIVQIAKSQNVLFGGIENFLVSRALKATSTEDQRHNLLHCMYAVSVADDTISGEEEKVIDQIAKELGIQRQNLIAIRSEYNEKRAVVKAMKDLQN